MRVHGSPLSTLPRTLLALALGLTLVLIQPLRSATAEGQSIGKPIEFSSDHAVGERYMNVTLRGALQLSPTVIDRLSLVELSGLAWDEDESILYAVSDGGTLFWLRPVFDNGVLRGIKALRGVRLKARDGKSLGKPYNDSEGLSAINAADGIRGNTRLIVSYERVPRAWVHEPDGTFIESIAMLKSLSDITSYRDRNMALEAVTVHPQLGPLVGPESPMKADPDDTIGIFSSRARVFDYPKLDAPNGSLVAMDVLSDGGLLTLDRAFSRASLSLVVTLRLSAPRSAANGDMSASGWNSPRELARFHSDQNFALDNFEGMTLVQPNHVLIVSDDNENFFQKTILAYLEITL